MDLERIGRYQEKRKRLEECQNCGEQVVEPEISEEIIDMIKSYKYTSKNYGFTCCRTTNHLILLLINFTTTRYFKIIGYEDTGLKVCSLLS